jgi:hypothetical protein
MNALFNALKTQKMYSFSLFPRHTHQKKNARLAKMELPHQLTNLSITIVRLMRKTSVDQVFEYDLGNCKPCEHCNKYLLRYRVKTVKYTNVIDGERVLCEMKYIPEENIAYDPNAKYPH